MDENKLIDSYESGKIDALCMGIMINSVRTTGRLYKELCINNIEIENYNEKTTYDIKEDMLPLLLEALREYESKKRKHFLEANFNCILLKMYYEDKMTYEQIENKTGIKRTRVRNSIIASERWLKEYIKNKINI